MRILIIGQYYYPDNFKLNDITFELVKLGHAVTVLTGLPDYTTGKVPKEYRYFKKRKENINGVKVIRVPIIARRTGIIRRALNYLSFLFMSSIKVRFIEKDFDIIFCYQTSPITMAHAAVKYKKLTDKKFLLYCLDLWPESLKAWDIRESSLLFKIVKKYSKKIYSSCNKIAISSLPFKEYLVQNCGVKEANIIYLPQYADAIERSKKTVHKECINFAFGGNIGKVQDVECIIRAVHRLRDVNGFAVHIYGNGSSYDKCKKLAAELGVNSYVRFYGRVEKQQLLKEYKKVDVFLLTLKQVGFIGMTVPAKLQEYMSAGKPLIAAINGAAADVIMKANCGILGDASNDEQLADNMREYLVNRDKYADFGDNAYRFYKQNFTKEIFLERLTNIMDSIQ